MIDEAELNRTMDELREKAVALWGEPIAFRFVRDAETTLTLLAKGGWKIESRAPNELFAAQQMLREWPQVLASEGRLPVIEAEDVSPHWPQGRSEETPVVPPRTTAQEIIAVCDEIKALLLTKNAAYGDSAVNPLRVFSRQDAVEQIKVRIDDKLSRLSRGHALPDETLSDTTYDLIGYLVLFLVARRKQG